MCLRIIVQTIPLNPWGIISALPSVFIYHASACSHGMSITSERLTTLEFNQQYVWLFLMILSISNIFIYYNLPYPHNT